MAKPLFKPHITHTTPQTCIVSLKPEEGEDVTVCLFRYNLATCANSYSPPGEMGYRASTVVTYHTQIETGHVPTMRGHLAWGAGVPSHCKWSPEDREELEPRIKAGKMAGNEGNFHIPDNTLAQLSVKELNKRVSQVSLTSHFLPGPLPVLFLSSSCPLSFYPLYVLSLFSCGVTARICLYKSQLIYIL